MLPCWNRTRDLWDCSQELWPLDHRRGPLNPTQRSINHITWNSWQSCLSIQDVTWLIFTWRSPNLGRACNQRRGFPRNPYLEFIDMLAVIMAHILLQSVQLISIIKWLNQESCDVTLWLQMGRQVKDDKIQTHSQHEPWFFRPYQFYLRLRSVMSYLRDIPFPF
jgi:hypothetical protein